MTARWSSRIVLAAGDDVVGCNILIHRPGLPVAWRGTPQRALTPEPASVCRAGPAP